MKRIICLLLAMVMVFGLSTSVMATGTDIYKMEDLTAAETLKEIGIGWNLGNTFDSLHPNNDYKDEDGNYLPYAYETGWGSAITSPELVKTVKAMGFRGIRLPVTWGKNMDADYVISDAYMDRVEEVVNYILAEDMYCMLNVHHDTGDAGWLRADASKADEIMEKYTAMWEQIAERFKDYGSKLIFEGYNEILDPDANWGGSTPENMKVANDLNQAFVDIVRASGSNNATRVLSVNTYAASCSADDALDQFVIPNDTVKDKLMIQVHCYDPQRFCWTPSYISNPTSKWVENRDEFVRALEDIFGELYDRFVSKGYPVVIGEFAANNKNNTKEREAYVTDFVKMARDHGIYCFWWDVNFRKESFEYDPFDGSCGLMDRHKLEWLFPTLAEALVNAAFDDIKTSAKEFTVSPIGDWTETGKELEPKVTVTYKGKTLTEGVDYTLSYMNNVEPGVGTVYVVGAGDYYSSTEVNFNIAKNVLDDILYIVGGVAVVMVIVVVVVTASRNKKDRAVTEAPAEETTETKAE